MTLETEIYQILKKHRLSLKKREEVIVDLLDFINKREKAITATPCCEELKGKEALSFEDWYITYGYAKSVTGNFVKEGIRYTADEMQFKYEYNMP